MLLKEKFLEFSLKEEFLEGPLEDEFLKGAFNLTPIMPRGVNLSGRRLTQISRDFVIAQKDKISRDFVIAQNDKFPGLLSL